MKAHKLWLDFPRQHCFPKLCMLWHADESQCDSAEELVRRNGVF